MKEETKTIKISRSPSYITKLVDLTPESIEKIAEAVVKKLKEEAAE